MLKSIESVFDELGARKEADRIIFNSIRKIVKETIPEEDLEKGFHHFIRYNQTENDEGIELAILTLNNTVHDFTFYSNRHDTAFGRLTKSTVITFSSYYPKLETNASVNLLSHRAELTIEISGMIRGFNYSVEGDRKLVKKLENFAHKCLLALHKI